MKKIKTDLHLLGGYIWAIYCDIDKYQKFYNVKLSEKDQADLELFKGLFDERKITNCNDEDLIELTKLYERIYCAFSRIAERARHAASIEYDKIKNDMVQSGIIEISECLKSCDVKKLCELCHISSDVANYYISLYQQNKLVFNPEADIDLLQLAADLCECSGINQTLDRTFYEPGYNSLLR